MITVIASFTFAFLFVNPLIPRTVNVVLFFGILYYLLRKPVNQFFTERFSRIRAALSRAAKEKEEAQARIAAIDARLVGLDAEIAKIHETAKAEAILEEQRLEAQTAMEVDKIREFAAREIEAARQNALAELRQFTASSAVVLAEQLIRRELTPEDDASLLKRASQEIRM